MVNNVLKVGIKLIKNLYSEASLVDSLLQDLFSTYMQLYLLINWCVIYINYLYQLSKHAILFAGTLVCTTVFKTNVLVPKAYRP